MYIRIHISNGTELSVANIYKIFSKKYLDTCSKCGDKIDENAVRTKGSDEAYHPDCFVCYKCGNVLHGKFYNTDDGQHLCETDFMVIIFLNKLRFLVCEKKYNLNDF